jgi:6-phosphogluconolactonase (cycloisomerase 2 family)
MGNAAEFGLVVGTGGNAFVSLSLNTAASSLHLRSSVPVTKPTWIALDHKTNDVFAVSELADGPYGQVTLFGATGNGLSTTWQSPGRWNAQTSSSGTAYASIAYRDGKPFYLAANYAGGTADVFDATGQRTDYRAYSGSGPFPGRQEASHAHQIIEDLSHEYVYGEQFLFIANMLICSD